MTNNLPTILTQLSAQLGPQPHPIQPIFPYGLPLPARNTKSASAGFYHSPGWNRDYPKLQILDFGF